MKYSDIVKIAQGKLGVDDIYPLGPVTITALDAAHAPDWSVSRRIVWVVQTHLQKAGFPCGEIDGYWGPQTDSMYAVCKAKSGYRRPSENYTDDDLIRLWGSPGTNQITIGTPYPLEISWRPGQFTERVTCNKLAANSLAAVLYKVRDHFGLEKIKELRLDQYGGCLNVRKMRGGTKWSRHAFGTALDFDPVHNKLRWHSDKASLARPEYNDWWEIWEDAGWESLGRAKNFDWMHVQATSAVVR